MENQPAAPASAPTFPDSVTIPDFYADGTGIQGGALSIAIIFTKTGGPFGLPQHVGVARLSPQTALLLSRQMQQLIESYEAQIGPIVLPAELLQSTERSEKE